MDINLQVQAAAKRFGWSDIELSHALASVGNEYENESVLPLINGRCINTPAYPDECDYVRITQAGFELCYWTSDEWAEDAANVMGAIMGCAHGSKKMADGCIIDQTVKHWNSEQYTGDQCEHNTEFQLQVLNGTLASGGSVFVELGPVEGDIDDIMSVGVEISSDPISNSDVQAAHVYFDTDNLAFSAFKTNHEYLIRMESGVGLERVYVESDKNGIYYKTKAV